MEASARVVVDGDGRFTVLRSEPPLVLRRTGTAEVHLVGGAAGPLGGDRLRLEIEIAPGARLRLRTVAAAVALPGPDGAPSLVGVHAVLGAGASLEWLPEPVIAAARCDHRAVSTVELAAGARLVWREELVCGRHGEAPGDARLSTVVRYDGRPLYHHELAVGPSAPGWDGPAVLGGARAIGSVLLVNQPEPAVAATVLPLEGPGVVVVALGRDLREVREALDTRPQQHGKAAETVAGSTRVDSPMVRRA
jgi:urease accessory protein